jgi:1-deoxyxylulose-5-phosphate synthase
MDRLNRREFLRRASAAGILASTGSLSWSTVAAAGRPASAADRVTLGRTGIQASYLAQGTGVNGSARQSNHTRMGEETAVRLIRYGFDHGLNFLDLADLYGTHGMAAKALAGVPREEYVLLSKIWAREESWVKPSGGAIEELDRFRKELNTDMVDIVLIHAQTDPNWPQVHERIRDELSELKQRGVIRAAGVSCHSFGALEAAAAHPWTDLIFARINNRGGREFSMDGTAPDVAAVLRTARENGKAVVGMKIFGVGKLTAPEQMDESLRYVIGNGLVDAMTIGMMKTEEMDDTIRRIGRVLNG